MPWIELAQTAALTAVVALAMVLPLWLISMPQRDISIIDMAFSALIAALLVAAYRLAGANRAIPDLILVLVLIRAARMSIYLVHRNWGHGEDPRYTRLNCT